MYTHYELCIHVLNYDMLLYKIMFDAILKFMQSADYIMQFEDLGVVK